MIIAWWRRRQHDKEIRRRCCEFESAPARFTRSPWIRSLIASPMFQENVPAPGSPRKISVSDPAKATGRGYIDDLLELEYCVRFRHHRWAWRGIFTAMALDVIEAVYTEERDRIHRELIVTCPDEKLWPGRRQGIAAIQGMVGDHVKAATKSLAVKAGKANE